MEKAIVGIRGLYYPMFEFMDFMIVWPDVFGHVASVDTSRTVDPKPALFSFWEPNFTITCQIACALRTAVCGSSWLRIKNSGI